MSCCGDKRSRIYNDPSNHIRSIGEMPEGQFVNVPPNAHFKYTGLTAMTVRGAVTGQVYRFERPESMLEVDRRDASYMAGIPNLKKEPGKKG